MLKKLFYKRKRQEPKRHNMSKIAMDAASIAILTRHFSPVSCRAKSPSDLLDIVGYPHSIVFSPVFNSTSATIEEPVLTVRNNTTPQEILLLETSREDKTLVEEITSPMDQQLNLLKQRLVAFERERESWRQKLLAYMQREEQLRKIIQDNKERIKELTYYPRYSKPAYYADDSYYTDNNIYYLKSSNYTDPYQPYYYYHD